LSAPPPSGDLSQPAPGSSLAVRLAAFLVDQRVWLALIAVVLTALAVRQSKHLEFSRSIDTMFDRSDPALVPYQRMTRAFGSSEVVLAAYDDPELFTPGGIARLRALAAELEAVPGVASTTSLANTPLGDSIIDLDRGLTAGWARRLVELLEGYVVGPDHRTAAVACVLEPPPAAADTQRKQAVSRAGTIDSLRERMASMPAGTVAGEPAMLRDGFAMLERDGNLLGTGSGLLAGAVLLACFRSLRWLVVPLAVVLVSLWTTRGLLAVAGLKLTMVSTMLSAMVTVVGIGTVTHVIVEYRRLRGLGTPPDAALRSTLTRLFWPVAGAMATDVIGFGSLTASNVGPVHDFGIMTSIGAAMVLVAVGLVVPFLALAGRFDPDPRMAWGEGVLERGLDALVRRIVLHPLPILAAAAAITVVCTAGMRWLTVETDFTRNFRPRAHRRRTARRARPARRQAAERGRRAEAGRGSNGRPDEGDERGRRARRRAARAPPGAGPDRQRDAPAGGRPAAGVREVARGPRPAGWRHVAAAHAPGPGAAAGGGQAGHHRPGAEDRRGGVSRHR